MSVWPVQDAKARFSELLEACSPRGPAVTKAWGRGCSSGRYSEWRRLREAARPSLKDLLLAPVAAWRTQHSETWLGKAPPLELK